MRRVLLASTLLLCACPAGRPPGMDKLRLQLDWVPEPEFGGIYAALERGWFREERLEVEVVKGSAGVATPQLVASGQADLGVMAAEQLLAARARGGPLVAVFATFQTNPIALMVHASHPARTLEEVWRGRGPVAVEPGQSFVRFLSGRYGTTPRLVPYQGTLATFQADPGLAQQCFLSAEPVQMELSGVAVRVFTVAESGFDPYNGVVATSERVLSGRGDAVRRFVRALRRGWEAYLADPAAFNPAIARLNPAMPLEAMNLAAVRLRPLVEGGAARRLGLGAMEARRWEDLAAQLVDLGALSRAPEGRLFVNP